MKSPPQSPNKFMTGVSQGFRFQTLCVVRAMYVDAGKEMNTAACRHSCRVLPLQQENPNPKTRGGGFP